MNCVSLGGWMTADARKKMKLFFSLILGVALSAAMAGSAAAADSTTRAPQNFYQAGNGFLDSIYLGVGGQGSRINGGPLTNADTCQTATSPISFFDCGPPPVGGGTSATANDGSWGGGFRVEVGARLPVVRLFTLAQGNYFGDVTYDVRGLPPGAVGRIPINTYAHTLTFGAGVDSAALFPNLLPAAWNIGLQGSLGPSWNTLGDLRPKGSLAGNTIEFHTRGGTRTALAGELGVFVQHAFSDLAALQIGYSSTWLGRFETRPGRETRRTNGVLDQVEFVDSVKTNKRRVDLILLQIVLRPAKLFQH
jgi:hypothetical protein